MVTFFLGFTLGIIAASFVQYLTALAYQRELNKTPYPQD